MLLRFAVLGAMVAGLTVFPVSIARAEIIIDTFEEGPLSLSDSSLTANPSLNQGAAQGLTTFNVIKAVRSVTLNTSAPDDDAAQLILQLISVDDGIEMISNVAESEVHYILSYSGFFGFPSANNLNTDFSQEAGFLLTFDRVDFALAATIRVNSNVPDHTTFAIATIVITHPGVWFVDFDDFEDFDDMKEFGWANVRNINIDLNANSDTNLGAVRLTDIRAGFDIPEPATVLLIAAGSPVLLRRRLPFHRFTKG